MKKIPTYFERDWNGDRSRVVNKVHVDCDWVTNGEGTATIKLDGMCCAIRDGRPFKRREIKKGKPIPDNMIVEMTDKATGKTVGWMPVGDGPEDRYFKEGFERFQDVPEDGTFELVGPKSQGGIEKAFSWHEWVRHGALQPTEQPPRDFEGLKNWLEGQDIEGIVWHHPDGRMAKLKLRDFGLKRNNQVRSDRWH